VEAKLVTWTPQRRRTDGSSQEFLITLEATGDPAFALDAAGRISAWNKAAAELFGRSEAEVMREPCHGLLQCFDEDDMNCAKYCAVERWADNRPRMNFDLQVQAKAGRVWCNVSTLIGSDPSGERYAIHIVRPIEIRKRLAQALSEFVRMHVSGNGNGKTLICSDSTPGINLHLTRREVEVLKILAKGHSTRSIANDLNISSSTVRNHIKHVLAKFGAHTRLEAIRRAEIAGII
jgi:PAS domain S-box-containing protein